LPPDSQPRPAANPPGHLLDAPPYYVRNGRPIQWLDDCWRFSEHGSGGNRRRLERQQPQPHGGDGTGRFAAVVDGGTPDGGPATAIDDPFEGTAFFEDVDGDGNFDIVSQGYSSSGWFRGDGEGHFGTMQTFPDPDMDGSSVQYQGIAIADFNGDGHKDVARLAFNPSLLGLSVCLGTGPGSFGPATLEPLPFDTYTSEPPAAFAVTQANLDGQIDLAVMAFIAGDAAYDLPTAITLLGDGTGHFSPGAPTPLVPTLGDFGSGNAIFADFNGDGFLDVGTDFWSGAHSVGDYAVDVFVAFGDGHGAFGSPVQTSLTVMFPYYGFAAADFTGDGKADLVGFLADPSSRYGQDLQVLVSTGTSFLSPQRIVSGPPSSVNASTLQAVPADLNGDGTPDIVVAVTAPLGRTAVEGILVAPEPAGSSAGGQ
jgi:hypothetical protein